MSENANFLVTYNHLKQYSNATTYLSCFKDNPIEFLSFQADIIVFPESSLIGYLNQQKLLNVPDPKEKVNPCTDVGDYEKVSR